MTTGVTTEQVCSGAVFARDGQLRCHRGGRERRPAATRRDALRRLQGNEEQASEASAGVYAGELCDGSFDGPR